MDRWVWYIDEFVEFVILQQQRNCIECSAFAIEDEEGVGEKP